MKRLIPAALVAATILAVPATANAATTCKSVRKEGAHVTLTAWGATSCALALETYRAARRGYNRRDVFPSSMLVRSPATGKRYRMRLENTDETDDYLSFVYVGRGVGRSTLNVQAQIRY